MYISGGTFKGKTIKIPPGDSLRPSQNQVRLAIFNMLESNYLPNLYYDELTVADLYAGSGTLGLEALSRGVKHVDFVEKNNTHVKYLHDNLRVIKTNNCANIHTTPVEKFLQWAVPGSYDLIFADPPYDLSDTMPVADVLKLLKSHGVLIFLHDYHYTPAEGRIDHRRYGATVVSFYTLRSVDK